MQAFNYLEQNATTSGIDLRTSSDKDRLGVYRHTLDAVRKLPDKIDMRTIGIDALNVLEDDLRKIINGLDAMRSKADGTARPKSLVAIITQTRLARVELSVASDMLKRDDKDSAIARREFYTSIIKWQEYLEEALRYF